MKLIMLCLCFVLWAPIAVQTAEALQVEPTAYDFGTVAIGETGIREFRLRNRGDDDVRLFSIALKDSPTFFQITQSTCNNTLREGSNCRVWVAFAPLAVGSWAAELLIVSDDEQPELIIPLQGTGGGNSEPPPTEPPPTEPPPTEPPVLTGIEVRDSVAPFNDCTIPFGEVPVELGKRKFFEIINRNAEEIEIISLSEPTAPFFTENDHCTGVRLRPLTGCTVEVVFTPSVSGDHATTLVLNTTAVGEEAVSITLSGRGIAPSADFPAPVLIHPEDGQLEMKDSVLFRWTNCRSAAGALANYRVHTGQEPVLPEAPARRVTTNFLSMGFGLGGLFFLFRTGQRRKGLLLTLLAVLLMVACSDDVEDSSLATVTQLERDSTYYWQVVAEYDDGIEAKSEIRSFTTR